MSDTSDLVEAGLFIIETDSQPGVRFALNISDLAGPSGFSMKVTELQHTFLVVFEPHSLARPLINVLIKEILQDSRSISSMRERVNESSMALALRINGKDFWEGKEMTSESDSGASALGQSIEIEVSGRLRTDGSESRRSVLGPSREAVKIMAEFVLGTLKPAVGSDIDIETEPVEEGLSQTVIVNRYERDPRVRRACIAHFGTTCKVCGFDFGNVYGTLGRDFIEVHHISPLAQGGGEGVLVDPIRDVVPVCSNCHSMIHRGGQTRDLDEVRAAIRET